MARLEATSPAGSPASYMESDEFSHLQATSDALPEGDVVGAVLRFPAADSYAYYLVTADEPLTLRHLNYGDGWTIPAPYIRGLEREDVLQMLEHRRRLLSFTRRPRTAT